ncbi:hypothetical protein CSV69_01795 [Sporosarcina sp. P26b]|uniref:hypothetical protein n=1 Tax=Sporosarcina sp. P26b TaxID=2048253 RepID=UPI000C165F92|nr:hypothetical protein [Sporosarcina sp. P26b]PIC97672.1 hypothetical protein CSV69_01795 [Sporosarcina sp. P26b]
MNKKQLSWAAVGAAVLLFALIIAIVSNKETTETVMKEPMITDTSTPDTLEESSEELVLQEESKKDQSEVEAPDKEVPNREESKKEQSTNPDTDSSKNVQSTPKAQPSTSAPKPPEPQKQPTSAATTPIKDGTYQVGADIEPGEYLVFSNGITLLENTKDQSGNPDSIVFNVALDGRSHTYVTLLQGEYFTLKGGEMYPVASAPDIKPANGIYKDGQYKVGTDIPAGTHTLKVDDQNDIGFYEISKNSRQDMIDLLVSDVVEGETSINVTDGQYLTIRNAYLEAQ